MFLIAFPLLLVPFVLYNIGAFIFGIADWNKPFTSVHLISGGNWAISIGDLLIAFSILVLFAEVLKSTRIGVRTIIDHMLSMLIFMAMGVEFIVVERAATSTFFLLLVIGFVDVLGGFTITIRTAQRNIEFQGTDPITHSTS
jgi:hypothetical protein